jgi:hypothetical protein
MPDPGLPYEPRPPDPLLVSEALAVSADEYQDGFGEPLAKTLDLETWTTGENLASIYGRIEAEVRDAIAQENLVRAEIRKRVFPLLGAYPGSPPSAGVYSAKLADLHRVHHGLLFNGGVEACDGTQQVHDTLPLTILQMGISLVSYQGHQGTWGQRLFRRDLRVASGDPTQEMLDLLERRERRGGLNQPSRRDSLSELARRGIMAYGERAILLRRSTATWRMGHGNPAPYELITGSGSLDLMIEATRIIRELVEQHQKFVFVSSEPSDRVLLTIGQALIPLEFAIVGTLKERIENTVEHGHYRGRFTVDSHWDGQKLSAEEWIRKFRDDIAPLVVVGVYRATELAPPQMFFAHRDHADIAAHIVLADSVLQAHRGFPLLIDLADNVCRGVFGGDTLSGPVSAAYADVGAPWQYLSERATRYA